LHTAKSYLTGGHDTETWSKVVKVLKDLGADAMSSDESGPETSARYEPKAFWRIPKPWLSPSITALMQAIDAQPVKRKPGVSARYRTSPPPLHARALNEIVDAHNMAYVGELPTNWYNEMFLLSLRPTEREELGAKDPSALPSLVSTVIAYGTITN
jgi:hypothetical protein